MITVEDFKNIATFLGMPALICGILLYLYQRRGNRAEIRRCRDKERKEDRETEAQRLLITGVLASIELSILNAEALRTGKTNGEMKEALDTAHKFKADTQAFLVKYFNG